MESKVKIAGQNEINKNVPVPLYYQLIQILMDDIKSGKLKPGDAIPTENELQKLYGLSRTTIRKAISELIHENVVEARRPKGVFVCKSRASEMSNGILTSFTEEFILAGYTPGSKLLNMQVVPANHLIAEQLNMIEGTPIHYIYRLRFLNNEAVSISHAYVPYSIAPNLTKDDFSDSGNTQSLYWTLSKKYGIQLVRAIETISAVILSKEESALLEVQPGLPATVRSRQVSDDNDSVVLYEKSILRYSYKTTLVSK